MVLGSAIALAVIGMVGQIPAMDNDACISRARKIVALASNGLSRPESLTFSRVEERPEFPGYAFIWFLEGSAGVDRYSGYTPFIHYNLPQQDEAAKTKQSILNDGFVSRRLQELCDAARFGFRIRVVPEQLNYETGQVYFSPIVNGHRFASWHCRNAYFDPETGAVTDIYLRWMPEVPTRNPDVQPVRHEKARMISDSEVFSRTKNPFLKVSGIWEPVYGYPRVGILNEPPPISERDRPSVNRKCKSQLIYQLGYKHGSTGMTACHVTVDATNGRILSYEVNYGGGTSGTVGAIPHSFDLATFGSREIHLKNACFTIAKGSAMSGILLRLVASDATVWARFNVAKGLLSIKTPKNSIMLKPDAKTLNALRAFIKKANS